MKESIDEFRYKEIEDEYKESLRQDVKKFFSLDRNKKPIECPLCKSDDFENNLCTIYGLDIIECVCNFMYIYPRPTEEEQQNFYQFGKSNKLWHEVMHKTRDKRKHNFIKNIAPLITKYLVNKKQLIDVGCGKGIWLDAVKETSPNLHLFGLDPFADNEIKTKYDIIEDFIENVSYECEFDSCSLMSVIEHVRDPVGVIKQCYRMLRKDGIMFITAPNMRGFDSSALDVHDRNWEIPQHINFFDVKTAVQCVQSCGFCVLESGTFGRLDVDIVSKSKNIDNDFVKSVVHGDDRVKDNFQKFLIDNNLSGQLYVVATK